MQTAQQNTFRQLTARTAHKPLSKLSATISYSNPSDILSPIQAFRHQHRQMFLHQPIGHDQIAGDTWDSQHLDSFLVRSRFSANRFSETHRTMCNSSYPKRSPLDTTEYFFRKTEDNKNTSHIGFERDNPMVSGHGVLDGASVRVRDRLERQKEQPKEDNHRYRFVAQSLKFKRTDPLTFKDAYQKDDRNHEYNKTRLKYLIEKRYPKGMLGVDNPELPQSVFYTKENKQIRIREEPNSHKDYEIDSEWKTKKHTGPFFHQQKHKPNIRKFRNTSSCNYNILSNRG